MGCTCESKSIEQPAARAVELPTTGYSFIPKVPMMFLFFLTT